MLSRVGVRAARALSVRSGAVATRSFGTSRPVRTSDEENKFFEELHQDLTSLDARNDLAQMQRQLRQIDTLCASSAEKPKAIDFAYYRSKISRPGVVDSVEKASVEALKSVENLAFDVAAMVKQSDDKMDELIKEAEKLAAESVEAKKTLEAELANVRAEKEAIVDLTIEDELKKNPEIAAEIEKEIQEDKWFVL